MSFLERLVTRDGQEESDTYAPQRTQQDIFNKSISYIHYNSSTTKNGPLYNDTYQLPQGWNAFRDEHDRTYYVNYNQNISQWRNPLTNLVNIDQHTDPAWPQEPPSIDRFTPYYLQHIGGVTDEVKYYEQDNAEPQPLQNVHHPRSPLYWEHESQQNYATMKPLLTKEYMEGLPTRPMSKDVTYDKRPGYLTTCVDVIKYHKLLSVLTLTMLLTGPVAVYWAFSFGISTLPTPTHVSWHFPIMITLFLLSYALYFLLFLLPTCGWWCPCPCINLGCAGWFVSYDFITPLKRRVRSKNVDIVDVVDKFNRFQNAIPVLSVTAEAYHFPSEDEVGKRGAKNKNSGYDHHSIYIPAGVNQAAEYTRHNPVQKQNTAPPQEDGFFFSATQEDPVLSYRTRRVIPIAAHRDVSTPTSTIQDVLFVDTNNPFDVIEVSYSNRFELHPTQIPLLDHLLKQYYYLWYTKDEHCNASITYELNSDVERWSEPTYRDYIFLDDLGPRQRGKNGSYIWACFFKFSFTVTLARYLGLYLLLLVIWRRSSVHYHYHNVKYLHITPHETLDATQQAHVQNGVVKMQDATNDKRMQYHMLDQVLHRGERATRIGARPGGALAPATQSQQQGQGDENNLFLSNRNSSSSSATGISASDFSTAILPTNLSFIIPQDQVEPVKPAAKPFNDPQTRAKSPTIFGTQRGAPPPPRTSISAAPQGFATQPGGGSKKQGALPPPPRPSISQTPVKAAMPAQHTASSPPPPSSSSSSSTTPAEPTPSKLQRPKAFQRLPSTGSADSRPSSSAATQ